VARVGFSHVTKDFRGVRAVDDLSLEVDEGEFVVLVGPSGCGKTTALRMTAGLETVTDGEISIGGRVVNDVPSSKRDIAMVFQNYALYPHLTVFENIAFGLQQRRIPRKEVKQRVVEIARKLELDQLLNRKPKALSGGQRQRVAMGRAIVRHPAAFLMDEPLSNLDAKLRVQMRAEIRALQRDLGTTTIYVTHDQIEAMTMGDRVAVIRRGVLQQVARPNELYRRPANIFVAGFIGSPAMNLVEAEVVRNEGIALRIGEDELRLLDEAARRRVGARAGERLALGVRPEDVRVAESFEAGTTLRGEVFDVEDLGAEVVVHLDIDAVPVVTDDVREIVGDSDRVSLETLSAEARERRTRVLARLPAQTELRVRDVVPVTFEQRALHFFDLATGVAIAPGAEGRKGEGESTPGDPEVVRALDEETYADEQAFGAALTSKETTARARSPARRTSGGSYQT
jgi:multiple sugar transport system ATP-binding protein